MPITADSSRAAIPNTPPHGSENEPPRYRVMRQLQPAERDRYRQERPFSEQGNMDSYQYGTRILKAGEIVETREWPHPSFFPLNDVARRIHSFFSIAQKSRMARSPYGH